jgi:putative toxin-antitoxin system antitoxin component (TIGR02293 family)
MSSALEAVAEVAGVLGLGDRGNAASATPFWFISMIEGGLPVSALDRVSGLLAPADAAFRFRIVPKATLARRRKHADERLTAEESGKVARAARVWAFAREVWGSDEAAREFLFRPHPLLEGRRPVDVALATELGGQLVEDLLGQLRYGSAA